MRSTRRELLKAAAILPSIFFHGCTQPVEPTSIAEPTPETNTTPVSTSPTPSPDPAPGPGPAPDPNPPKPAPPPPPPAKSKLKPTSEVVNPTNGTKAILRHHGYAQGNHKGLIESLREAGLKPRLRTSGYGKGTWEISGATYGWMFYVQKKFISDAGSVSMQDDDLWAAYEKQSLG